VNIIFDYRGVKFLFNAEATLIPSFLDLPVLKTYISFTPELMKLLILSAIFAITVSVGAQEATTGANECVRVTASTATLRGRPSLTAKALDIVSKNTQLESIAKRETWVLVQAEDYAGWIESKWIEPCVAGTVSKTPVLPSSPAAMTSSGNSAATSPPTQVASSQPATSETRTYTRGPKGGCYYINSSGRKVYVDHSLCS